MYRTHTRYKKIIECMDPEEIVDILELTSEEIVERFYDVIEEKLERFEWMLGDIYNEEEEDDII